METAIFAAGCFWKPQYEFSKIKGVAKTTVGYTGGRTKNPSYFMVCTGLTGHAEAVKVEFNPEEVSYSELVKKFLEIHNPTTRNRQGWDIGSQYRSAIYYLNEKQRMTAKKILGEAQTRLNKKIVTELLPAKSFYDAEEYHQDYYKKHNKTSC